MDHTVEKSQATSTVGPTRSAYYYYRNEFLSCAAFRDGVLQNFVPTSLRAVLQIICTPPNNHVIWIKGVFKTVFEERTTSCLLRITCIGLWKIAFRMPEANQEITLTRMTDIPGP